MMKIISFSLQHFTWQDIKLTLPVMMGYVPIGCIFGVLLTNLGVDWFITPMFSLIVFAGAGQFLIVSMLSAGADIVTIAIAVTLINTRHIFYGLPFIAYQWHYCWQKYLFSFWLTDETYSILTSPNAPKNTNKILILAGINYFYWFFGSVIGALLANLLPSDNIMGLDYAMILLFFILTYEQARALKQITPFFIGLAALIFAYIVTPQSLFLSAIGFSSAALIINYYIYHGHKHYHND